MLQILLFFSITLKSCEGASGKRGLTMTPDNDLLDLFPGAVGDGVTAFVVLDVVNEGFDGLSG